MPDESLMTEEEACWSGCPQCQEYDIDWHELGKRATPRQLTALLRGAEKAKTADPLRVIVAALPGATLVWRIVHYDDGGARTDKGW